jgi:subtilisin family serine protease
MMRVTAWLAGLLIAGWVACPATAAASPAGDWYLGQDQAAQALPELPLSLAPVRVAVIDSGIDGGHPALAGSLVAARSFVGGTPLLDTIGHGTFVAGEIAAGRKPRSRQRAGRAKRECSHGSGIAFSRPYLQVAVAKAKAY